jgi:hypothetical protein
MKPTDHSQRSRLLALLVRARGGWVPLPEVMAAAGAQYGARVHSLRHDLKFNVQNWQEGSHSWFRLVSGPSLPPPTPQRKPETSEQAALFGDLSPTRYPD